MTIFTRYCIDITEVRGSLTGALKMQDWKMTDESAGLENDGLEFAKVEI